MTNNITRAAKDLSGKVALLDVCCNAVSSAKEPINLGLVDKAKGCTCVPDELRDTASNAGRQRIERRLDIADRYAANLEAVVFFGLRRRRRAGGSRRRLTPDGDGNLPDHAVLLAVQVGLQLRKLIRAKWHVTQRISVSVLLKDVVQITHGSKTSNVYSSLAMLSICRSCCLRAIT